MSTCSPVGLPMTDAQDARDIDLDAFVPALISFIANRLTSTGSATFRRRLGVGIMEFRVMVMLALEPGASGARIGEVIGLDKAAVSRALSRLVERGFVEVTPGRARVYANRLTPEGLAAYEQGQRLALQREALLLSGLSRDEQGLLRDLLRRLLAATPALRDLAASDFGHPN